MKLLDYLLESNLAPGEREARGLIMRGDVLVNEVPQTSPAYELKETEVVRVRGDLSGNVSRGREKIAPVLDALGIEVIGKTCIDLGVSTGGFTQALLERDAAKVYCVDVAYGVTALEVRNDSRVVMLERTNVRALSRDQISEDIQLAVGDLSFISWNAALPAVIPVLAENAELLLLVKPQFEIAAAGKEGLLENGIVVENEYVMEALNSLESLWNGHALTPLAVVPAGVKGARGNQEYFVWLTRAAQSSATTYTELVQNAVKEARE